MVKKLSQIARDEWIALIWTETTSMNDEERIFTSGFRRTPDEAAQAREDWDSTEEERQACRETSIL